MTPPPDHVQVTAVGDPELAVWFDETVASGDATLTVTTATVEEACAQTDGTDCLLVEGGTTDGSWRARLERLTDCRPDCPVVVVLDHEYETAIPAATEAGAADQFPRSLCESDPGYVVARLASLAEQSVDTEPTDRLTDPEQRFELVTENVDEIIYIANEDFSAVEYVNTAYEDVWGRPIEELYEDGTAFIDGIDPRDRDAFEAEFEAMVADFERGDPEESYEFEFRVRRPDGDIRWVLATGYPARADTGGNRFVGVVEDVTERRELEETYRELFENVSDGLVVHEPETGEILDANQRFCEMTGYSHDELVGETVELVSADDETYSPQWATELISRVRDEGAHLFEWRGQRKNGETYPVEVHLTLADFRGTEQVLASVRDISDRKEAETRFQTIVERIDAGVMLVPEGESEPSYLNPVYEELTGIPVEELYDSATFVELIHPDDRPGYVDDVGAMIDDIQSGDARDSYDFEFRFQRPDGETRWFHWAGYPLVDEDHDYWYVGLTTDVTERRERQQRVRENERTYRELFNGVSAAITVHDPDRKEMTGVNETMCELLGYDRETILEKDVDGVSVTEDGFSMARGEAIIDRVMESGEPEEFEWLLEDADDERHWMLVTGTPAMINGQRRYLATSQEITERKQRERTVTNLHAAIDRIQDAETETAVYDIVVETAREVLDLPMAACWHEEGSELSYVAGTEPVEGMDRGPVSFSPADHEYEVFTAGEAVTYDPSQYHDHNPLEEALMVPIGDHGLLAAGERGTDAHDSYLLDAAQVLAGHASTALDRVERGREVRDRERQLKAIVDRIDDAIFLAPISELDSGDPAPDFVSSGYEEIWGQSLERLHETYEEGFFDTLYDDDRDDYVTVIEQIIADVEQGTPADRYDHEYRIERPDGDLRWVHSDFYPTEWREGPPRIVIVSRDVTDRKERERTLESFHDATAELTTAETVTEAGETAVDAAADVFALPATAVYHYEEETGQLAPAATGPALPNAETLPSVTADDRTVWHVFVEERMTHVESASVPPLVDGPSEDVLVLPLGGNGVLAVWRTGDELDTDAATILAATLEAALNRLRGERQLESRREELEAHAARARRLESITEVTQRVEAAITTASSRQGITEAVCGELTDVSPFAASWIAEAEVGTDRLTPRALAGIDRDEAEQVVAGDRSDGVDRSPAASVWQTGESYVENNLVGGGRRSDWRQTLLRSGAGSVCAVPLAHGGVTYGTLTVVADEPDTFGDREVDVLSQLGSSIGYAMTAIERQRALESDDTLELEFQGAEMPLPFARLARDLSCRVQHERTIRRQDGSVGVYYSLHGELPDDVAGHADEVLPGDIEVVSRQAEHAVIERRGSSWFGEVVSEYGGVLRRGRATDGGVTLLVELPQETNVRTIVDRLQQAFPDLELTAQRQHRETRSTPGEIHDRLEQRLSDRQYEALETAHAMGYFDWPRENSGEAVAQSLGITQPTVNKHLRLAEHKVFELLFGSASS